jgi:hypothetical protein
MEQILINYTKTENAELLVVKTDKVSAMVTDEQKRIDFIAELKVLIDKYI